jgi:hypothetical protein
MEGRSRAASGRQDSRCGAARVCFSAEREDEADVRRKILALQILVWRILARRVVVWRGAGLPVGDHSRGRRWLREQDAVPIRDVLPAGLRNGDEASGRGAARDACRRSSGVRRAGTEAFRRAASRREACGPEGAPSRNMRRLGVVHQGAVRQAEMRDGNRAGVVALPAAGADYAAPSAADGLLCGKRDAVEWGAQQTAAGRARVREPFRGASLR